VTKWPEVRKEYKLPSFRILQDIHCQAHTADKFIREFAAKELQLAIGR
jgi:hypothetical protein